MRTSYAKLVVGYIKNKYFCNYQKLIFTNVISMTAAALLHPAEQNSTDLLPQSIFSPGSKREVFEISLAFLDIKLSINTTVYLLAYTTNQQILLTTFVLSSTIRKNTIILSVS